VKHTPETPEFARLHEVFNLEGATPFGGSNLLIDYGTHLGLWDALRDALQPVEKRPNARFRLADTAAVLLVGRILGLERISAFDLIEEDSLLRLKFGLPKLPDYTLLYKDLARLGAPAARAALAPVHDQVVRRIVGTRVVLDLDSTVETVYGQPQEAAVGYNPTKRGRASYHPLVAFDGHTRAALYAQLRPGNAVSATDVLPFLDDTLAHLPPGCRVTALRADKGFQSEALFAWCEGHAMDYTIKLKVTHSLLTRMEHWCYRAIGEVAGDILEVAAGIYQARGWFQPRRIIAIRKRMTGNLFAYCYDYQAIVTTLDWDPEDVFHYYNQRCTMETMIREAKAGFGIDAITSYHVDANRADLALKLLAYNLALAFQRDCGPGTDAPHRFIETVRRRLLHIPAVVVYHARQWTLRLAARYQRWGYEAWRQRLDALSA
jgi:hypothetical protein